MDNPPQMLAAVGLGRCAIALVLFQTRSLASLARPGAIESLACPDQSQSLYDRHSKRILLVEEVLLYHPLRHRLEETCPRLFDYLLASIRNLAQKTFPNSHSTIVPPCRIALVESNNLFVAIKV